MRSVPFAVRHETWEEAGAAGRYNRGLVVCFRDRQDNHRLPIGAGESDDVEVYREEGVTYVLTRNYRLGYVGLECFQGDDQLGEVFTQSEDEIDEILGRDGLERSGWWVARVLAQYAMAGV